MPDTEDSPAHPVVPCTDPARPGGAGATRVAVGKLPDDELVRLARRSDQNAFTELYRRCVNVVYLGAFRVLRDNGLAEDVVQEAFVIALQSLDKVKNPAAFRAWVTTIAVRLALARVKASRRLLLVLDSGVATQNEPGDDGAGVARLEAAQVPIELLIASFLSLPLELRLEYLGLTSQQRAQVRGAETEGRDKATLDRNKRQKVFNARKQVLAGVDSGWTRDFVELLLARLPGGAPAQVLDRCVVPAGEIAVMLKALELAADELVADPVLFCVLQRLKTDLQISAGDNSP